MNYELFFVPLHSIMHKKRIEYIDLAKGICMFLVVMGHIQEAFASEEIKEISYVLSYFRMPLYFMLSGMFFKKYNSFRYFFTKKVNHLLVPYLSFLLLGLLTFRNYPIWFLFSLFFSNIVFYFCKLLSERLGHESILPILCIIFPVVGFYLPNGRGCTDLLAEHLYYIETSLTCIGFYCVGYYLKNNTEFLTSIHVREGVFFVILCALIVYGVGWYYDYADTGFRLNFFEFPILPLYIAGLAGSVGIIYLAKLLCYLPYFSFIGRYSIIVLLTHFPITTVLVKLLPGKMLLVTILVLLLEIPVILVGKRCFPYLFAQKELFPLHSNS